MRTTIRLDDGLLKQVKQVASETGRTITSIIEDALRESLAKRSKGRRRRHVRLKTFKGKGLQPGVDLDDSAALLDLMEGDDAAG